MGERTVHHLLVETLRCSGINTMKSTLTVPVCFCERIEENLLIIYSAMEQVELSHPDAELRLLEIFCHKIRKIFPPHERIGTIDQHRTLRAEEDTKMQGLNGFEQLVEPPKRHRGVITDPREKAKSETRDWLNNVVWS
nr:ubiquitin carboxyl-terminal hydrolase 12-like [Ipomoea batatas]